MGISVHMLSNKEKWHFPELYLQNFNFIRTAKISDLMDMPPVALISYSDKSSSELYYPKPLMQLWKECTEVNSAKASSAGHFIIVTFFTFIDWRNCTILKTLTAIYFIKAEHPSSSQEQQPRTSPPREFPPQVILDSYFLQQNME